MSHIFQADFIIKKLFINGYWDSGIKESLRRARNKGIGDSTKRRNGGAGIFMNPAAMERNKTIKETASYRFITFILPFLLEGVAFYNFCHYDFFSIASFLTWTVLVTFTFLGSFILFCPTTHTSSAFAFGHVCGAFLFHLFLFLKYLLRWNSYFVLLNHLFITLLLPYVFLLLASHFAPSGHFQNPQVDLTNISNFIINKNLKNANFCATCLVRSPFFLFLQPWSPS